MKTVRTFLLAAMVVLGLMAATSAAQAYWMTGLGGKLGMLSPEDGDGTASFSGHLEFEETGSRVHLLPSLTYWSSDGLSDVNPNFDMYYHFSPEGSVAPYMGMGFGLHFYDFEGRRGASGSETDPSLNLFGGLRFPAASSHFFVEGRYVATELSQASVLGGVTFHLGH